MRARFECMRMERTARVRWWIQNNRRLARIELAAVACVEDADFDLAQQRPTGDKINDTKDVRGHNVTWGVRHETPACCSPWPMFGRGDDTVGNPHRAQIAQFELFKFILLSKSDKQVPVEQFEATVSQSAVPSPPLLYAFCSRSKGRRAARLLLLLIVIMILNYIYIYIYIHTYMCVYIYIHIYIYVFVYVCVYIYIYIYIYIYLSISLSL